MAVCPFCHNDPESPKASHLFADTPSQPNYDLGDAVQFTLRNAPGLIGIFTTLAAFVRGFIGAWKKPSGAMLILFALLPLFGGCAWSAALGYPWKDTPTIPGPTTTPKPSPSATPAPSPVPSPTASPTPGPVSPPTPGPGVPAECPPLVSLKLSPMGQAIDVTPMTDRAHCTGVFVGRNQCPLGEEGTQQRTLCEAVRIGADGPLWIRECESGDDTSCIIVQANPYLGKMRGPGPFKVCSRVSQVCAIWP